MVCSRFGEDIRGAGGRLPYVELLKAVQRFLTETVDAGTELLTANRRS
jgi:hypothetical protein